MFEDYKRLTDPKGEHLMCENCPRYKTDACSDSLDCAEVLCAKLNLFETALENGTLVELTPERVSALLACIHGTVSNKRVMPATYTKFKRLGNGKVEITHEIRFEDAVTVLADMTAPCIASEKIKHGR